MYWYMCVHVHLMMNNAPVIRLLYQVNPDDSQRPIDAAVVKFLGLIFNTIASASCNTPDMVVLLRKRGLA